jgi:hypothetical protein
MGQRRKAGGAGGGRPAVTNSHTSNITHIQSSWQSGAQLEGATEKVPVEAEVGDGVEPVAGLWPVSLTCMCRWPVSLASIPSPSH